VTKIFLSPFLLEHPTLTMATSDDNEFDKDVNDDSDDLKNFKGKKRKYKSVYKKRYRE